jgi:5-methylthioribose kinase
VILDDDNLADYLLACGQASSGEPVRVLAAGDGNINFVRRLQVGERSLVVKQARPALERFPEYRVTTERIVFERRYGDVTAELAPHAPALLPRLLHFDEQNRVLVMEDLGDCARLDERLRAGHLPLDGLAELGAFLGAVHSASRPQSTLLREQFANQEMQRLHGEHIFTLPYQENDFPLSAELRAEAGRILQRPGLRERIRGLGERYYADGDALVHGDVQAGNLLVQGERLRLVDAEIAHVGDPAFDVGTALAHLWVHIPLGGSAADPRPGAGALREAYLAAGGRAEDLGHAPAFAGAEIMRRSIGAARLECLAGDREAAAALAFGAGLVLDGPTSHLW